MNQFAKYSTDDPNKQPATPADVSGDFLHNLHNDFIALAQSVEDLKQELASIKVSYHEEIESLKLEIKVATTNDEPQAITPPQQQPEEDSIALSQEDTNQTHMEEAKDNVLGMSDDEIQALLLLANEPTVSEEIFKEELIYAPNTEDDFVSNDEETLSETSEQDFEIFTREIPEATFEINVQAIKAVPATMAIGALAIPICIEDKTLICKVVEPFDIIALDIIAEHTHLKIVPQSAPIAEVIGSLRKYYGPEAYETEREAVAQIATTSKRSFLKRRTA